MEEEIRNHLNSDIFKRICNSLNIGIHIIDYKGITIFYNDICQKIDGLYEEWIIGKDMNELVKQEIFSDSIGLEVIKKGKKISKTQSVNNKYIYATGVPIYIDNKLILVVSNVVDITKIQELKQKYNELNMLNLINTKKDPIIYRSRVMEKTIMYAFKVSRVDITVLIEGETGVGKGVLSKHIHNTSERSDKPFVKIDCSSLSENIIEAELFGYEPGSFTGADEKGKIGLLKIAEGGTLFLDEIGELPLKVQVKLLDIIENKTFRKVGGLKNINVDTRIIAATNKDLELMVEEGTFRKDLYYRLKVVKITIPPLRERKDDIIPLINYFLNKFNKKYNYNKIISSEVMKLLINYEWPGNVRELENKIEKLVVVSETEIIREEDILEEDIAKIKLFKNDYGKTFKERVYEYEKEILKRYIADSKDIKDLSKKTNLEKSTLRKKAKRLKIDINFNEEK